jgi:ubiquinone/menaquinone biosynthesis C-methylase UbiE
VRLSDWIFGWFLEWSMSSKAITRQRPPALKDARGNVLEIGFGTGLNLPCYPAGVTQLMVVDPEDLLPQRVAARISAAPFPVTRVTLSAERLPLEDDAFDCAVSTFTLCTIPDASAALREVRRVLKRDGRFLFLEHGLSEEPSVAKWQSRLNPIQRRIGRGCNLDRRIDSLIGDAGLEIIRLDRFLIPGMPRTHATMYRGIATARK